MKSFANLFSLQKRRGPSRILLRLSLGGGLASPPVLVQLDVPPQVVHGIESFLARPAPAWFQIFAGEQAMARSWALWMRPLSTSGRW